jgi:hypothetical protein
MDEDTDDFDYCSEFEGYMHKADVPAAPSAAAEKVHFVPLLPVLSPRRRVPVIEPLTPASTPVPDKAPPSEHAVPVNPSIRPQTPHAFESKSSEELVMLVQKASAEDVAPEPSQPPRAPEPSHFRQARLFDSMLSRKQAAEFAMYTSRNRSKLRFVVDSFSVKHEILHGVTNDDLARLISVKRQKGQHYVSKLLEDVLLVGDGCASIETQILDAECQKTTFVVYVKRSDDKYNIIVGEGTQKRRLNRRKVATCLGGSLLVITAGIACLVFSLGAVIPVVVAGGVGVIGTVAKAVHDYHTSFTNVLTGCLLNMLEEDGVIAIHDDGIEFIDLK